MFNSTVLEVAVGLVFCFSSLSLMVSSINEAIASLLRLRARTLLTGIKALLNDKEFTGVALALYNHALVNPKGDGNANSVKTLKHKPSYIDPQKFAAAFVDSIQSVPGNFNQLSQDIDAIADPQLKNMLRGMYVRAGGEIDKLHAELSAWFDSGMARISGDYRRRAQFISVAIALVLAVTFNIDAFHLFKTLWQHPALVAQINVVQQTSTPELMNQLWVLPIGWAGVPHLEAADIPYKLLGWLVTASSAIFGAPFWFDLLLGLTQLRGSGPKPDGSVLSPLRDLAQKTGQRGEV
jgi:hypothetical protein